MSILRTLVLAGTIGLSTVVTSLVAADRLAHGGVSPPRTSVARAPVAEPETTGTVTQQAEPAKPVRLVNGFDTERLNALMRGEIPPPPEPTRRR